MFFMVFMIKKGILKDSLLTLKLSSFSYFYDYYFNNSSLFSGYTLMYLMELAYLRD